MDPRLRAYVDRRSWGAAFVPSAPYGHAAGTGLRASNRFDPIHPVLGLSSESMVTPVSTAKCSACGIRLFFLPWFSGPFLSGVFVNGSPVLPLDCVGVLVHGIMSE